MREIPAQDFDPPQLGALILFGIIGAIGGILGGFVASFTPLAEAGFVLGVVLGPLVAAWTAWRQGTNALGAAIVLAAAVATYVVVAVSFGVNTIPDAEAQ